MTFTTETLDLAERFDIRDLAAKASELKSIIHTDGEVSAKTKELLIVLNAGLENFLTGEYAVAEPESEELPIWSDFASDVAQSFTLIGDNYDVTFWHADATADALAEQAEELEWYTNIPAHIQSAIDWNKVDIFLNTSGVYKEIFIDGETYVCGVYAQ